MPSDFSHEYLVTPVCVGLIGAITKTKKSDVGIVEFVIVVVKTIRLTAA